MENSSTGSNNKPKFHAKSDHVEIMYRLNNSRTFKFFFEQIQSRSRTINKGSGFVSDYVEVLHNKYHKISLSRGGHT